MSGSLLALYPQRFFTDHLSIRLRTSAHTIASYRDSFRLLLNYASERLNQQPTDLKFEDLDAKLISHFLSHLENVRGNSIRSRNARLSAIRSFFKFVACLSGQHRHPPYVVCFLEVCSRSRPHIWWVSVTTG